MVSEDECPKPVRLSTSWDRKTGYTAMAILFFKAPSTAVYFFKQCLVLSEFFSSE